MTAYFLVGMVLILGQGPTGGSAAADPPMAAPVAVGPTGFAFSPTPGGDVPALSPDDAPVSAAVAVPGLTLAGQEAASPTTTPVAVEPPRRAMPSPFSAPPFPGTEYQGYPLIGLPPDNSRWPLMKTLQGTPIQDFLDSNRIRAYGWVTVEGNASNAHQSNTPDSYWIRPNNVDMDQFIFRLDRNLDSVQTDHIDWGFRSTALFGIDYRYMTAGGWGIRQLQEHNLLYGWDPTEQYFDLYVPKVAQGLIIRVGRWIACPDIETQFAPDNYMGSHSLLFTFDTYTQTGVMGTLMLDKQWTVQGAIHSGTDMAPWYPGAIPTGAFGIRWVSQSNNDAFYGWLNAINNARFRRFMVDGKMEGHDNFNYWVQTWEHRFNPNIVTKTEGYIMWQRDAVVGGTPSFGNMSGFGGGTGLGANIPGITYTFGVVNFTVFGLTKWDLLTIRNEWWKDTDGERSGFASTYTSNAIGWAHYFGPNILFRPEIGYYRSWTVPAFDNGRLKNLLMVGADCTFRF